MRDIKRENDDKLNSFPENFSHDDTYISDWEAAADNVYSSRQCVRSFLSLVPNLG